MTRDNSQRVLLVLDVDEVLVLNTVHLPMIRADDPEWHWVRNSDGQGFWVKPNLDVLRQLEQQASRPRVELLWLTAWGRAVANMIAGPFAGMLTGGTVLAERPVSRFIPADWKLTALLDHLEEERWPAYVWVDDTAVPDALSYRTQFRVPGGRWFTDNRLLIAPSPNHGLTLGDVERISRFIDGVQQ